MTRLRIFWLGCLPLAAASQLAYHFIDPPTLDNQGMLHEQFGLIPLGLLLTGLGLVALVVDGIGALKAWRRRSRRA